MMISTIEINENNLLVRKNLFLKLDSFHSKKLITLTAGNGFGKRTLISSYLKHNNIHYTWFTLQSPLTTLQEFLSTIIMHLESIQQNQLETLPINQQVDEVINLLLKKKDPYWLILEGCEHIQFENHHFSLLNSFIDRLPNHVTCVFLGKRLPNKITQSKWKMQGKLLSINSEDLAFNKEDIKYLFHSIYQLQISDFEIERTLQETEGWAAGIALYYEAVKELPSIDREQFWNHIKTGDDIYQYITNEIIEELPHHLHEFLYYCSLCRTIDKEIFIEVFPNLSVHEAIHELEDKGVIMIYDANGTPRLHELFRRYLYKKALIELGEEKIQIFHGQVSLTFLKKYQFFNALSHSLASGNAQKTAEIMNLMIDRYEPEHFLQLIDGWLESISPSLDLSMTSLLIFRCIPVKLSERLIDPLLLLLKKFENVNPAITLNIYHRLATIYFYKGELKKAIIDYNNSLNLAKQIDNRPMIALNTSMLAQMYRFIKNKEKSISLAKKALLLAEKDGYDHTQMHSLWNLSEIMVDGGDIHLGKRFAMESIDVSLKCDDAAVIYPYCTISKYYRKTNQLDKSFQWVEKAVKHAEKYQIETDLGWAYTELALWYKDNQQFELAEQYIKKAEELFKSFRHHNCIVRLHLVDILREFNKNEEAQKILDDIKKTVKKYDYGWITFYEPKIEPGIDEKLTLKLLGSFEIKVGRKQIKISRKSSKRLLFLLATQYKRRWSKEEIIGKLFPDEDEEIASNYFNVALSYLRKELEPDLKKGRDSKYIKYDGSHYYFVYENIDCDFKKLNDLLDDPINTNTSLETYIQLYSGDLLEEYPYEDFLIEKRDELKSDYLDVLKKLVKESEGNRKLEQSYQIYEKMIQVDPFEEQFYLNYIKSLLKTGQRNKAHQIANKAIQYIEVELGIPIQSEIESLLTIKSK
ncbi:tetratricopeptide repeat protein [Lysinibacillus endophyticus]|uniref:tetratricopeptide repeat protein n=1 Tax=Ureibacillus endophyticus TaxID=1978490 RepID=UPI0031365A07